MIATLSNPREKFWGMILALASEGLSLSGAELASFEDLSVMVRDGEPFTPAVVFFPMHRIERVRTRSAGRQFALALPTLPHQDWTGTLPHYSHPKIRKSRARPNHTRLEERVKLSQIFTAPNQLTLLRMIFVPFIVIQLVDGHYGWALRDIHRCWFQ